MDIWKELEAEDVNRHLLAEVRSFRDAHGVAEEVRGRIPNPRFVYYGKDVWEAAAAAVLCGENLLLAGPKAQHSSGGRRQHLPPGKRPAHSAASCWSLAALAASTASTPARLSRKM